MPKKLTPTPSHLSPEAAQWWCEVVEAYALEPHHMKLLRLACESFDRCQQARAAIDRDGITVPAGDSVKSHPAIAIERDSRLAFARILREMDLDTEPVQDRRPPALRSNRRG
ncbi:P27 family phage terminase small subunit [Roseovarius sp. MBR-6]|uniref:P27 family phage terminase small subunit n=1 Tax=Roseovarius sp. MBR-6 TaxID=3156459 RepID=UPI003394663A